MPCVEPQHQEHREKDAPAPFNVMVTRLMTKAEVKSNAKAQKAMRHEWDRLVNKGTYDFKSVTESYKVRADARRDQKKVHIG